MTIVHVNGTPLQPAIDAAQPGDTIVPSAGTYAGRLTVTKPLTFELGAAIIDGGQGDGFKNVNVTSRNVVIRDGELRHGGAAIQFNGDCTGSLVQRTSIPIVDWMVVNGAKPNNGGMGIALPKAVGVTLEDLKISRCRARSTQYGIDGAAFEFFAARDITIRRCETWDNVVVSEWGRNPTDPLNTNVLIEDCVFHGRADWQTPATYTGVATYAGGHYLRAVDGLVARRNLFDRVDAWCWALETQGGYGGPLKNIVIDDNRARLNSKWFAAKATDPIPTADIRSDHNALWPMPGQVLVDVGGKRPTTKAGVVAAFGWEANSYVGPEQAPSPPPPPPPPPVPLPDPCAQVKADLAAVALQRDQAITDAAMVRQALNTMTADRDGLRAKITAAKAALA